MIKQLLVLSLLLAIAQPACAQEEKIPPVEYAETQEVFKSTAKKYPLLYSQVSEPPAPKVSVPILTNTETGETFDVLPLEHEDLVENGKMKNPVYDASGKKVHVWRHPWVWMDGQKLDHPVAWEYIDKRVRPVADIGVKVVTLIMAIAGAVN